MKGAVLIPRQCIRNVTLTGASGAILDVLNKMFFQKENHTLLGAEIYINPIQTV